MRGIRGRMARGRVPKAFGAEVQERGQGDRQQAGRLFNSKREGHGREPTSRGRYEGRAARATTARRPIARRGIARGEAVLKLVFQRNEPDWQMRNYARMLQGGRRVGSAK